jgi:hypothetical protein
VPKATSEEVYCCHGGAAYFPTPKMRAFKIDSFLQTVKNVYTLLLILWFSQVNLWLMMPWILKNISSFSFSFLSDESDFQYEALMLGF